MKAKKELTFTLNQDEAETLAKFFKCLNPTNVCSAMDLYESDSFVGKVLNTITDFKEAYDEINEL